jgi:hypothetical protein
MTSERPSAAPATPPPTGHSRRLTTPPPLPDDPVELPPSRTDEDAALRHPALLPGSTTVDRRLATRVPVRLHAAGGGHVAADPQPPTTYRLERGRRRAIGLLAVGVAGLGLAVAAGSTTLAATHGQRGVAEAFLTAAPAVLLLLSALVLARAGQRMRLVLDDEGIRYHGFVSVLTTTWQDVARLDRVGRGIFEGTGILLARPAQVRAPGLFRRLGLAASADFVPLDPFTERLVGSALEADLLGHCPKLFRTTPTTTGRL